MLSWVWRHKSKFLLLGAAVAGSYVGGRWLLGRAREARDGRRSREQEERRLHRHCESHRQTSLAAVVSLLPRLREAVQAQLNAESVTEELRRRSSGKVTLWENLKIICFARVVVGVYLCCSVSAFLLVQLSVLGGELSLHHQQGSDESAEAQLQCLSSVQHLLGEGLAGLVGRVRPAAERVLVSYSLKHQLTSEGVGQLLADIRSLSSSPGPSAGAGGPSFLVQFLLPREQSFQTTGEGVAASTRDIVESREFSAVLEGCVDQAFSLLCRQMADVHHSAAQSEATLPVARVIPLLADMFGVIFSSHSSSLAQVVTASPQLHELSRNVFEAFSHPSEP